MTNTFKSFTYNFNYLKGICAFSLSITRIKIMCYLLSTNKTATFKNNKIVATKLFNKLPKNLKESLNKSNAKHWLIKE